MCRLLHLKIISLKKPLQIGLCNKAVCSPSYLEQFAENVTAEELFGRTLLYLDDSQKDWITWSEWFESVNYPEVKPKNRVNINNYPMLLQAAMNGQGVALAWGSLVDEYLDNGTLVRPVETVLRTQANFCMLEPSDRGVIPSSVKQFRTWLLDQLPGQVGQKGLG